MKKLLGRLLFKLYGWKLIGEVPKEITKYVLIAAPHTSNMDFFLAMPTMWSLGLPGRFLIKKEHTDAFYGFLLKMMGGIGVDRTNQSLDFVEQLKQIVENNDELAMLFTPEGTRKRVEKWKTGFYRVALAMNVPIILAYADYSKKEVHIGHVLNPIRDFEKDFAYMENFYKDVVPKHSTGYNPEIFTRKTD